MKRYYRSVLAPLLALMVFSTGCSQNPKPGTTVQANVAHHATTIVKAVSEVQSLVTSIAQADARAVPTAQKITTIIEGISARAKTLSAGLRTYDATTSIDLRRIELSKIQTDIASINQLLGDVFKVQFDSGVMAQVSSLVSKVAQAVSLLSAELAKGW